MKEIELSDERIKELFEGTNFGPVGDTPIGRRGLMVDAVLKIAAGYAEGNIMTRICMEAGLIINGRGAYTKEGVRWAFNQIYDGRKTVFERLKQKFEGNA